MAAIAGIVYPDVYQIHHFLEPTLAALKLRSHPNAKIDSFMHKNFRMGSIGNTVALNRKQTIAAILDGQIYNTKEIHQSLLKEGISVDPQSHNELILGAYEAFGENFPLKLDGDFAIAIYDKTKELLLLYRDRVGCKPLYWFNDNRYFAFASEIKGLLAGGFVPQTPSEEALAAYLTFGYVPQDLTPIENVNKLLPAHYLKFSATNGISIHSYWSYSSFFNPKTKDNYQQITDHFDQLMKQSMQKRLPQDGSFGCYLTGGIGSASTAGYVRKMDPEGEIPSYSIAFEDENDEDFLAGVSFSKALHMQNTGKMITPETLLDNFLEMIWTLDEPLADPTTIASWQLAKLAQGHSPVTFSGMGSDELLAGHARYTTPESILSYKERVQDFGRLLLQKALTPLMHRIYSPKAIKYLYKSHSKAAHLHYLGQNCLFDETLLSLAAPSLAKAFNPDIFLQKFDRLQSIGSTTESFKYLDFKTRLPDCYVLQYERFNTAANIDWRSPFFDPRLIEFIASVAEPTELMEKDTASLLKTLMKGTLPDPLLQRPKMTRKYFLCSWSTKADLVKYFQLLASGSLVESGIISKDWIIHHSEQAFRCEDAFPYLWALLSLEVWFRLFINNPVRPDCPKVTLYEFLSGK